MTKICGHKGAACKSSTELLVCSPQKDPEKAFIGLERIFFSQGVPMTLRSHTTPPADAQNPSEQDLINLTKRSAEVKLENFWT